MWEKVIEVADKTLKKKISPDNLKALYFKGTAHMKLK